jgi:16S rRNA processing protein RimM
VEKDDFLLVGKIIGAHGRKGACKVYAYAESPSIFQANRPLLLRETSGRERTCRVSESKPHARSILLSLQGITNRNQAEALIGSKLFVKRSSLPPLEAGTYYWFEIIGMAVTTIQGEDLGRVETIIETGSNDVFVVRRDDREVLVPALAAVVVEIDTIKRRMRVDLPEGL